MPDLLTFKLLNRWLEWSFLLRSKNEYYAAAMDVNRAINQQSGKTLQHQIDVHYGESSVLSLVRLEYNWIPKITFWKLRFVIGGTGSLASFMTKIFSSSIKSMLTIYMSFVWDLEFADSDSKKR